LNLAYTFVVILADLKKGIPPKAAIPSNRGAIISIIGTICKKGVFDSTLRKSKAVKERISS
jgi:hypothetical protein